MQTRACGYVPEVYQQKRELLPMNMADFWDAVISGDIMNRHTLWLEKAL